MRLEFVGGSLVITNWMNGCWPVNNDRYTDTVNECVNLLQTFTKRHIAPRKRHTQCVRHVLRGNNEEADELATLGKNLLNNHSRLESMVQGSWQMLWRKCHRRRTPNISLLDHMFFQTSDTTKFLGPFASLELKTFCTVLAPFHILLLDLILG